MALLPLRGVGEVATYQTTGIPDASLPLVGIDPLTGKAGPFVAAAPAAGADSPVGDGTTNRIYVLSYFLHRPTLCRLWAVDVSASMNNRLAVASWVGPGIILRTFAG